MIADNNNNNNNNNTNIYRGRPQSLEGAFRCILRVDKISSHCPKTFVHRNLHFIHAINLPGD